MRELSLGIMLSRFLKTLVALAMISDGFSEMDPDMSKSIVITFVVLLYPPTIAFAPYVMALWYPVILERRYVANWCMEGAAPKYFCKSPIPKSDDGGSPKRAWTYEENFDGSKLVKLIVGYC